MTMQNFAKLVLAVLVTTQLLQTESAFAKLPKTSVLSFNTQDKEKLKDPYFKISSMKIKELTEEEALEFNETTNGVVNKGFTLPTPNVPPVPPSSSEGELTATTMNGVFAVLNGSMDTIIMVVDKLVAIGEKIVPVIKQGSPIVTNNTMTAVSVLPKSDVKDQTVSEMGDWSDPVSKHFKISYMNGFGMEVVSFVYSVSYQYNGSMNGKGKYLAGIRASAKNIVVSWGFDLDASSQLVQIANVGTKENVIAGATIEITYTVKNMLRTLTTSESFHIAGDGRFTKLD